MPQYITFEDLTIWQAARIASKKVYLLTREGQFLKDYGLRNQIQRAAVSIVSNIAERLERRSDKEFAHFLNIAKASLDVPRHCRNVTAK